jgi:hypothetical protein
VVVTVLMAAADTSEASAAGLALAEANINWERYAPEIPCPVTEEESFCSCPSVRVGCSDVVIYGEVVWGSDEKWGTGGGTGWFEEPDSRAHWTPPTTSLFCVFILVGGEVEDHEKVAVHLDGEQILTSSVSCKLCSDTVNT